MKIPISKNLSTHISDLVGTLEIQQDMADDMAKCYFQNLGFKIDACVEILDGKPSLKLVSISAMPVGPVHHAPDHKPPVAPDNC